MNPAPSINSKVTNLEDAGVHEQKEGAG